MAGLDICYCRVMVDGFRVYGFNKAEVIDDFSGLREELTDPGSTTPMLGKVEKNWR